MRDAGPRAAWSVGGGHQHRKATRLRAIKPPRPRTSKTGRNVFDDDRPLISIPLFESECAILSVDRPEIELEMRFGELPVFDLIEHLRALAPRAVAVVPGDPVPADPWRYAVAYSQILGACAALGIPTEMPRPIVGNRSHH